MNFRAWIKKTAAGVKYFLISGGAVFSIVAIFIYYSR